MPKSNTKIFKGPHQPRRGLHRLAGHGVAVYLPTGQHASKYAYAGAIVHPGRNHRGSEYHLHLFSVGILV